MEKSTKRTVLMTNRIAKALRTFLAFGATVGIALIPVGEASARCIRQSLLNHDYCGAEAGKLKYLIPDRAFGDFKGACAGHDACYQFGGEAIVVLMEQRYQQTMTGATRKQKSEFKSQIDRTRLSCDNSFIAAMNRACNRVGISQQVKCREASVLYYGAVRSKLGSNAFDQSIDQAFTCRTR